MDSDVISILDNMVNLLVNIVDSRENPASEQNPKNVDKITGECEAFINQLRGIVNEMYKENAVGKRQKHLRKLLNELQCMKREIINTQRNLELLDKQIAAVEAEIEQQSRELMSLTIVEKEKEKKKANSFLFLTKRGPTKRILIHPLSQRTSTRNKDIVLHLTPTLSTIPEVPEEEEETDDWEDQESSRISTLSLQSTLEDTEAIDSLSGLSDL